jgi:hypothetical protein
MTILYVRLNFKRSFDGKIVTRLPLALRGAINNAQAMLSERKRPYRHRANRLILTQRRRGQHTSFRRIGRFPAPPNGTLWNAGSDHSGLMLANFITFAHFSTSAVMKV